MLDAEDLFSAVNPSGVPGDDIFCDHVHFRFIGNYLLARRHAEAVAALLPQGWGAGTASWPSAAECARSLGLTGWAQYRIALSIRRQLAGELFQRQSNHAEREARLNQELGSLQPAIRPEALAQSSRELKEALTRRAQDWVLYDQLAKVSLAAGDRAAAAQAWSNEVRILPHAFMGHYQLGLLLNQPATAAEALAHLRIALKLRPFAAEVHVALGTAESHLGNFLEADRASSRALALDKSNQPARLAWAQSFIERKDVARARAQLELALAANPNSLPAHLALARLLEDQGRREFPAVREYGEVLRLDPLNTVARRFLGVSGSTPVP